MIAFGCATTDERTFRAGAMQAIERVSENSSLLLRRHRYVDIHEPYNAMLAQTAEREDLEALVLVRQDVLIEEDGFTARVRGVLTANSQIGVVGVTGGANPFDAMPEGGQRDAHEVESVSGALLVLSAWAVRELRFDASVAGSLDSLVADLCFQARERGHHVVATGFCVRRATYEEHSNRGMGLHSEVALQRKWLPDLVPRAL
jgi:hypothetical protein